MNTKNNIDQLFAPLKESTEAAPMHLWPKVEAAIAVEPKKKKRFLWLGLLGFLLLACSSLAVYAIKAQSANNLQIRNHQKAKTIATLPTKTSSLQTQSNQQTPTKIVFDHSTRADAKKSMNQDLLAKNKAKSHLLIPKKENTILFQNKQGVILPNKQTSSQASPFAKAIQKPNSGYITKHLKQPVSFLPKADMPKIEFTLQSPEKDCAGSRVIKVPKSIFVDAYVSPIFSNTFFTAKTSEMSSYAKLRDSTEKNAIGLLVGARVGYIHESGLNMRAGVAYQQVRNKFQYTVEQDEKMIIKIFRDNNGQIIGRDTTFEFGRRRLNVTNKYSTVDLPFSLGYISMKNKVQIGFHIGAVLNLNFRQSGTYIDQQSLVTRFDDKKIFEKSIGTSFFGSVELQYLLADQWGIFMEPQVRFYPKSLTSKGHPIKQNLTNFNVLTGIKYIF